MEQAFAGTPLRPAGARLAHCRAGGGLPARRRPGPRPPGARRGLAGARFRRAAALADRPPGGPGNAGGAGRCRPPGRGPDRLDAGRKSRCPDGCRASGAAGGGRQVRRSRPPNHHRAGRRQFRHPSVRRDRPGAGRYSALAARRGRRDHGRTDPRRSFGRSRRRPAQRPDPGARRADRPPLAHHRGARLRHRRAAR